MSIFLYSPGKIFVGEKYSLGQKFRHLTKISSLFPDEVFPDKVGNFVAKLEFISTSKGSRRLPMNGYGYVLDNK